MNTTIAEFEAQEEAKANAAARRALENGQIVPDKNTGAGYAVHRYSNAANAVLPIGLSFVAAELICLPMSGVQLIFHPHEIEARLHFLPVCLSVTDDDTAVALSVLTQQPFEAVMMHTPELMPPARRAFVGVLRKKPRKRLHHLMNQLRKALGLGVDCWILPKQKIPCNLEAALRELREVAARERGVAESRSRQTGMRKGWTGE